jgi:hypothetical protein
MKTYTAIDNWSLYLCALQAVINEDVHGNMQDLQAEVRKLKDQLAVYQSGQVVTSK